ncbi:MAG TPA: hypothetical protein VM165_16690 [Planctomycetaceae bacterium]|nr:hypothetical protein [Planctomycetaceae bacterium]
MMAEEVTVTIGGAELGPPITPPPDPLAIVTAMIAAEQADLDAMPDAADLVGSDRDKTAVEALRLTRQQRLEKLQAAVERFEGARRAVLAAAHNKSVWTKWHAFLTSTRNATAAKLRPLPQYGRDRNEQQLIEQSVFLLDLLDGKEQAPLGYGGSCCYVLPTDITKAMHAAGYTRKDATGALGLYQGWPWMGNLRDSKRRISEAAKQIEKADREVAAARRALEHAIK